MNQILAILTCALPVVIFAQQSDILIEIEDEIQKEIDSGESIGFSIGVVDEAGSRFYGFGETIRGSGLLPARNTIYRIGSVSKTLTAVLAAEYFLREGIELETPVVNLFRNSVQLPIRNGKPITLLSLANHTSGLPNRPDDWVDGLYNNPPIYSEEQLLSFLARYRLEREVGSALRYSSIGVSLVALAIADRENSSFDAMLEEYVLNPLGLSNTGVYETDDVLAKMAQRNVDITSLMEGLGPLEPGGGLHSTAEDLLLFVAANLGLQDTSLRSAMDFSHEPLGNWYTSESPGIAKVGIWWWIEGEDEEAIIVHGGNQPGFQAFIGFSKIHNKGVVVLTNSRADHPVSGPIGRRILNAIITD